MPSLFTAHVPMRLMRRRLATGTESVESVKSVILSLFASYLFDSDCRSTKVSNKEINGNN